MAFFNLKLGPHFVQTSSQLVFAGLRSSFPLAQPHSAVFSPYFVFTWRAEISLISPCHFSCLSLCISSSPAPSAAPSLLLLLSSHSHSVCQDNLSVHPSPWKFAPFVQRRAGMGEPMGLILLFVTLGLFHVKTCWGFILNVSFLFFKSASRTRNFSKSLIFSKLYLELQFHLADQ